MGGLYDALIPIAHAEGGNYVLLDTIENGAIYFWDHESSRPPIKIADNFECFLDCLEPFDADSIELKPDQIEQAWIDPDFLKNISDE